MTLCIPSYYVLIAWCIYMGAWPWHGIRTPLIYMQMVVHQFQSERLGGGAHAYRPDIMT